MKIKSKLLKLILFIGFVGAATIASTPLFNEEHNNLTIANAEALKDSSESAGYPTSQCHHANGICMVDKIEYLGVIIEKD